MTFAEKPPILTNDPKRDVPALRDWLFRLAGSLEQAASAPVLQTRASSSGAGAGGAKEALATAEALRKNAEELKALIIKNAREIYQYADSKTEEYKSMFLAQSAFGTFQEQIQTTIKTTARATVESYRYGSAISAVQGSIDTLQQYINNIDGEIRRGIVTDPATGQDVIGIAISQHLKFKAAIGPNDDRNPGDGYTYYEIDSGQTFGLYTSTGWQFWIDGVRRGWFDSTDGSMHIASVTVEEMMQLSDMWQITFRDLPLSDGTTARGVLEFVYMKRGQEET